MNNRAKSESRQLLVFALLSGLLGVGLWLYTGDIHAFYSFLPFVGIGFVMAFFWAVAG